MHQFSVALQAEVQRNLSVDIAYVGNRTVHGQLISVPDNVPVPAAGAIQTRRAFPQWGQFSLGLTNGTANYNALQVKVEKRYSNGMQLLGSTAIASAGLAATRAPQSSLACFPAPMRSATTTSNMSLR